MKTRTAACWPRLLLLAAFWALAGCATEPPRPDPLESVRPRVGRVVDADTGQPVAGAIILNAFYLWPKRSIGNFPVPKVFRDSAGAITDSNGEFTVRGPFDSQTWWTDGVYIFKRGYGPWRFQDHPETVPSTRDRPAQWQEQQQAWQRLTTTGAVIELRPLRTREERLKYIDRGWEPDEVLESRFSRQTPFTPSYFFDIPVDRLMPIQQAVDAERTNLGLPPRRLRGR